MMAAVLAGSHPSNGIALGSERRGDLPAIINHGEITTSLRSTTCSGPDGQLQLVCIKEQLRKYAAY
jgi:hypothetical protein